MLKPNVGGQNLILQILQAQVKYLMERSKVKPHQFDELGESQSQLDQHRVRVVTDGSD
jgi:hypothetical protein